MQSMFLAVTFIDKRFAVRSFGISSLALIFDLKVQERKNWFKVARRDNSYTVFFGRSMWTLAWWLRRVVWVLFPQGVKLTAAPRPFACNWARLCTYTRGFCTAAHSFFLKFRQWRSSTDKVLQLARILQLVGTHVLALGNLHSLWAKWQNRLGHCFSLNCRKYWKNSGPRWGFWNLHPHDWKKNLQQKATFLVKN